MNKNKLGIGMLVGWHIHGPDFAKKILSYPDCRLISVYDENQERGSAFAQKYHCAQAPSAQALMENPEIDALIICSATTQHAEDTIQAARHRKHVYIEKAPFSSLCDARRAKDAILENHIHFVFSNPIQQPDTLFARSLMQSGKLGRITGARIRAVHPNAITGDLPRQFFNLEESGGGALIDMGCKCVHTLTWLLGTPLSVTSIATKISACSKDSHVEDNAAAIFRFEGEQLGILETSWVSPKSQSAVDIYGTQGTIHISEKKVSYCLDGKNWVYPEKEDYPEPPIHPLRQWIQDILSGQAQSENTIEEAILLTRMLTAAYRSHGKEEPV